MNSIPRIHLSEQVSRILFIAAAGVSILAVALICVFLLVNGVPAIAQIGLPDFLLGTTWKPANDLYGIFPMIIGSIYVTVGALIVGVPAGILCAIFLAKFANGRLVRARAPASSCWPASPASSTASSAWWCSCPSSARGAWGQASRCWRPACCWAS